ncbi:hypothetical protein A1O3_10007 [Capronia epimyces CBS 606.96]|uniref:Enoyl reductase (ER) domain-containing protein n=1 Tax=Capronia epimyces CBS 606.96 TaxID=1182542 RepID=W9XC14_9EURO|nr:uncharacterized protein A1O3_10007 [Capronia epimyces CBS 606.96]EXJ77778.1 hypothetical protein A1O3_10007 [Capronia epimyces CBS 606.96]
MTNLPKTMKAWTVTRVGKPRDVLQLKTDSPTPPPPKAGEVMIRVSYVAINPADYKLMEFRIPFKNPAIPAIDFVGDIVQVGPATSNSSTNVRVGMTVAGSTPTTYILRGMGVLAEYVVLPAHAVVEKPQALDEAVAAGLFGVAGQTGARVLSAAGLHKGDRVLLNGASGGVGCILIQVLCGMGVRVTGVCSARNEARVRSLGAEEVVDYTAHKDLYGHLSSICSAPGKTAFDAIIDCVGNLELYYNSPGYLKPQGKCLSIEGSFLRELKFNYWPAMLGGTGRTYKSVMNNPSGTLAKTVAGWFEKGWIKEIPVDSVFSMDDAIQAFEKQATGRAVGKILVKVG